MLVGEPLLQEAFKKLMYVTLDSRASKYLSRPFC